MGINVFTDLSANDEEDDASEDIDWSDTIGLPEMGRFDQYFDEQSLLFCFAGSRFEDVKQVELK